MLLIVTYVTRIMVFVHKNAILNCRLLVSNQFSSFGSKMIVVKMTTFLEKDISDKTAKMAGLY